MESKKLSKGWVPAATAVGGALIVFAGCGHSTRNDTSATGSTTSAVAPQSGPYDDPAHPLYCPTSGDAADGVKDGSSYIIGADLLAPFPYTQIGWFGPPFAPTVPSGTPSCATPNPTSAVIGLDRTIYSDEFQLKNWTDTVACISIYAHTNPPWNNGSMQVAAYVGAFNRNDIAQNNVAASAPGDTVHIAFQVPASTNFQVVVIGASPVDADGKPLTGEPGRLDISYQLYIANCGQPPDGGGSSSGGTSSGGASSGGSSSGDMSSSGGSSSGGSTSGGDTDAGAPPPPATDDAGTGGKSW